MTTKKTKLTVSKEDFIRRYTKARAVEYDMLESTQKVLQYLCFNFEKREMKIDKKVLDEIQEQTKLVRGTISNTIHKLVKLKILTKHPRYNTLYTMKEEIFFGSKTDKMKFVLTIEKGE